MLRVIWITWICTVSLSAAVTTATSQITPYSTQISAVLSAGGNAIPAYQVKSGSCPAAAADLTYRENVKNDGVAGAGGTVYASLAGLTPSTTYCYAMGNFNGTSVTEWSAVGEFTTTAYTGGRPEPPVEPTVYAPGGMPTINGNTYNVASDCSDLQSILDTVRVVAGSANHQVVIPAGTVCTANYYLFDSRVGTGWIVVRTSTPDSELPPEGTRMIPTDYAGKFATLRTNACVFDSGGNAPIRMLDATSKWRFVGIEITVDQSVCNGLSTPSAITAGATTSITVNSHGLITGNLVRFVSTPGISGLTGATYSATVLDANTFTVATSTTGTYTGGGSAFLNDAGGAHHKVLVAIGGSTSDIVIDRCWLHGYDFPYRIKWGVFAYGSKTAIINSYIEKISYAYLALGSTIVGSAATPISIDASYCRECLFDNNTIDEQGFGIFNQESNAYQASDIVISRNDITIPARYRYNPNNLDSDGNVYENRVQIEFKQCERCSIVGNTLTGQFHSAANPGVAIELYSRGNVCCSNPTVNTISDITLDSNLIQYGAAGFQLVGDDSIPIYPVRSSRRIKLVNNLLIGMNAAYYRRDPATNAQQHTTCFWLIRSISELLLKNNTCWDLKGIGTYSVLLGHQTGGVWQITNNIFFWNSSPNGGNTLGGIMYDRGENGRQPTLASANATITSSTAATVINGMITPYNYFSNNLFIGGVKDSGLDPASYTSTDLAVMWNKYSLCDATNGVLKDFTANLCAGLNNSNDGSETAQERMDDVGFWASDIFRLKQSSSWASYDLGADYDSILQKNGTTLELRALNVTSSAATLAYIAPTASESCVVEYGTNSAYGTGTRVSDSSGNRFRTVNLTGLSSATTYYIRLNCRKAVSISLTTG